MSLSPGQQQRSPTPAPPSQSWLPCGVSTQLRPRGVPSLSPAPPPHPNAASLGIAHTFASSLVLSFKPRQSGTDKQEANKAKPHVQMLCAACEKGTSKYWCCCSLGLCTTLYRVQPPRCQEEVENVREVEDKTCQATA